MGNKEPQYRLTLNSQQAHELLHAVELFMRLKLGQYEELPFSLIDLDRDDFCDRRDEARAYLKPAFEALLGWKKIGGYKDDQWYRLYNMYQVVRYAIHNAEHPESTGVDSYPPLQFTSEPLPIIETIQGE